MVSNTNSSELVKKHIDDFKALSKKSKAHIRLIIDFNSDGEIFETIEIGNGATRELNRNLEKLCGLLEENKQINKTKNDGNDDE